MLNYTFTLPKMIMNDVNVKPDETGIYLCIVNPTDGSWGSMESHVLLGIFVKIIFYAAAAIFKYPFINDYFQIKL